MTSLLQLLSSGLGDYRGGLFKSLLPRGSVLFFTGLFLSPQLSVGVSGVWGTERKGHLVGDFKLSKGYLASKPWRGLPLSPPTTAAQCQLWGSLLVGAAAGHHGGEPHAHWSASRLQAQQCPSGPKPANSESFDSRLMLKLTFQLLLLSCNEKYPK